MDEQEQEHERADVAAGLSVETWVSLSALVAAYADAVDRRDHSELIRLFTPDGVLELPSPPDDLGPVKRYAGGAEIKTAFSALADVSITLHAIVGTVFRAERNEGSAAGRVSCIAHHLTEVRPGEVKNLVWHIRYEDSYERSGGRWCFASRRQQIDWIEVRPVNRWRAISD